MMIGGSVKRISVTLDVPIKIDSLRSSRFYERKCAAIFFSDCVYFLSVIIFANHLSTFNTNTVSLENGFSHNIYRHISFFIIKVEISYPRCIVSILYYVIFRVNSSATPNQPRSHNLSSWERGRHQTKAFKQITANGVFCVPRLFYCHVTIKYKLNLFHA